MPPFAKIPLHSVVLMMLIMGLAVLSLGLNQVLFVGTFVGWCGYGVLVAAALLVAAWRADGVAIIPAMLAIAVVGSPSALPYSFGVLLFACAFVLARDAVLADDAKSGKFAAILAGLWCVFALIRWYIISVSPELAAHETAIRLAGENWLPSFVWPRIAMPVGHANYTSGIGLLLLPVFIGLVWREKESKWLRVTWFLFSLASGVLLIGGGSRAAILALPFAFASWIAFAPGDLVSWKRKLNLLFFGFMTMIGTVALKPSILERFTKHDANLYSDLIRRDYVIGCWHMFLEKPFAGWGAGALPGQFAPFMPADGGKAACYHAHSTPFQWLVEFGIAGGLLFLAVALFSAVANIQSSRVMGCRSSILVGGAVSAAAYTIFSLFDYQTNIPILGAMWGAVLGVAFAGIKVIPQLRFFCRFRHLPRLVFAFTLLVFSVRITVEIPLRKEIFAAAQVMSHDRNLAARHLAAAVDASPDSSVGHGYAAFVFSLAAQDKPVSTRIEIATLVSREWAVAVESAPHYPPLRTYAAFAFAERDPHAACAAFKAALRADPKSPLAWRGLAESYARLDHPAAAEALALGCLVSPELALDPLLARGVFRTTPAAVLARLDALSLAYAKEFPSPARVIADLDTARMRLHLWHAAHGVPLVFLRRDTDPVVAGTPAIQLLLRHTTPETPREQTRRALVAVVFWHHRLSIDDATAERLLAQFIGESKEPFTGPRLVGVPESLLHFGSYLGVSDLATTTTQLQTRDDLWTSILFSPALNPLRLNRNFLLSRLDSLP